MNHLPNLLSIGQVASLLGVSRQRVEEFIRRGKLNYRKTDAGKIFLESEVLAFKKEREEKAKNNPRIRHKR